METSESLQGAGGVHAGLRVVAQGLGGGRAGGADRFAVFLMARFSGLASKAEAHAGWPSAPLWLLSPVMSAEPAFPSFSSRSKRRA
jgi:hypothetical protein